MPYEIRKFKTGVKVCKKTEPEKCFSKKPIPMKNAIKQKYAIEINERSKKGGADKEETELNTDDEEEEKEEKEESDEEVQSKEITDEMVQRAFKLYNERIKKLKKIINIYDEIMGIYTFEEIYKGIKKIYLENNEKLQLDYLICIYHEINPSDFDFEKKQIKSKAFKESKKWFREWNDNKSESVSEEESEEEDSSKKFSWMEEEEEEEKSDDEEHEDFSKKFSWIGKDGKSNYYLPKKLISIEYNYIKQIYNYLKKELENTNEPVKNAKGFIINKLNLNNPLVKGIIKLVKYIPNLTEWCYTKSGKERTSGFDIELDQYDQIGMTFLLSGDEIKLCSGSCGTLESDYLYFNFICSWKYQFLVFDAVKEHLQNGTSDLFEESFDYLKLTSVGSCDTVNFYSNQGSYMANSDINYITDRFKKYYDKGLFPLEELKEAFKEEEKPKLICNNKIINNVFEYCDAGGSKYFFNDHSDTHGFEQFDLYYLIRKLIPTLKEIPKEEEEDEEEEEEDLRIFNYKPDNKEELEEFTKNYEEYFDKNKKELKKANIYPVKTRDFHNLYRIIRTILINNNTNYWFRSVLLSIHPELESLGTINTPELGARTRIPLKIKQEIEKRIGQFNNDELDLKPIKEGSGIKSTKFFEELKKMDIDIDQYLKQIKANAKKNKYDPKLIDWAYDDVHKLKYFSPEGVKKFGRVGYKDLLIYKQLEKLGKVEKGTAEKMKKRFHKSHEAISKKNKLSVYSPNELALNVLW